jgi:hypothetical protein
MRLRILRSRVVGLIGLTLAALALRASGCLGYLALHSIGRATFRVSEPWMRLELMAVRADRLDVVVRDHFPVHAEYRFAPERMPGSSSRTRAGLPAS